MSVYLNNLKPALGSKTTKKRLGRGIGSGWGKTAGRGHKGQHARKGGYHKVGFEGGQTPLHRRMRKFGFRSTKQALTQEIPIGALEKLTDTTVDHQALRDAGLINGRIKQVKVIATGQLTKAINLKGLRVTQGARQMIESLQGSIED
jgi:large subunit ribosomal protein L15